MEPEKSENKKPEKPAAAEVRVLRILEEYIRALNEIKRCATVRADVPAKA